jgi:hypothetical protein
VGGVKVTVVDNRATYNGGNGVVFEGGRSSPSPATSPRTTRSRGFVLFASSSTFDGNRGDDNGLFGIDDGGLDNVYRDNRCTGNGVAPSHPLGLCR